MVRVTSARRLALDLLQRIDVDGAYANLVTPLALDRSGLSEADRRLVTALVAGTTRMRRACDALIDPHLRRTPDRLVRNLLRLGTFQMVFTDIPSYAAVSETVALAPRHQRGFVNAILRGVGRSEAEWQSDAERLSYPDWIFERLCEEFGLEQAISDLEAMNDPRPVPVRSDGYAQDISSLWVAQAVEAVPGETVIDLCAAPGGKSTALAALGATVIAIDISTGRLGLVASNANRLGSEISLVCADGRCAPIKLGSADAVLLDAPCSGVGALRRRADARWRITAADVDDLVQLQQQLLTEAAKMLRPGGRLVYSVCTLFAAESIAHRVPDGFEVDPRPPPGDFEPRRHGWIAHPGEGDGMSIVRYRKVRADR